eukprot:m.248886 g.248886  ORF g.248886 m.248886 type:complete len:57 (+) comp15870_c0_seq1:618-788(+)
MGTTLATPHDNNSYNDNNCECARPSHRARDGRGGAGRTRARRVLRSRGRGCSGAEA